MNISPGIAERKSDPLTAEEENALVRRWQTDGDVAARDAVVISLLPLCERLARRYKRPEHFEDLRSEAGLGALKAIDKFDPNRGVPLAAYAALHIKTALRVYIDRVPIVRPPEGKPPPPIVPLHARECDKEDKVVDIGDYVHKHTVDREISTALQVTTPLDNLIEAEREAAIVTSVTAALDQLSEREREVIRRHDLAEQPASFKKIGAALGGITGERARQLHASAIRKLRKEPGPLRPHLKPGPLRPPPHLKSVYRALLQILDEPQLRSVVRDRIERAAAERGMTPYWLLRRLPEQDIREIANGSRADHRPRNSVRPGRQAGQQALLPRNKLGVYSPNGIEAPPMAPDQKPDTVVATTEVRVEQEGAAWLVVCHDHGWLFGGRREAITEADAIARGFGVEVMVRA